MSAILKFDFHKREQLRFFEVDYLNYTKKTQFCMLHKKDPILHVATTFSLKQGETRTSHGPIPHPLRLINIQIKAAHKPTTKMHQACVIGLHTSKFLSRLNWVQ